MTTFKTLFVLAMVCLFAGSSMAAVFNIDADGDDKTWRDDGSAIWVGQRSAGVGYDSSQRELSHVMPFELPDLAGETIVGANLLMHAWDSAWGSSLNMDLYGLRWNASSATAASDHYDGPLDTASTLIMLDYAVKVAGNPAPVSERNVETDTAGDAALVAFLTSVYAAGAQPGDFVFLRVNPDMDYLSGSNSYIYFDTADTTSVQSGGATYFQVPVLTIETEIPEPASLGLLTIGGLMLIRRR